MPKASKDKDKKGTVKLRHEPFTVNPVGKLKPPKVSSSREDDMENEEDEAIPESLGTRIHDQARTQRMEFSTSDL